MRSETGASGAGALMAADCRPKGRSYTDAMSQSPQSGNTSAPLHRLLSQAADAVQGVREGRSLTELLARVPADLRPGTQALSFTALRRLGGAEAARQQLA